MTEANVRKRAFLSDKEQAILEVEWRSKPTKESVAEFDIRLAKRLDRLPGSIRGHRFRLGLMNRVQRNRSAVLNDPKKQPRIKGRIHVDDGRGTPMPPVEPLLKLRYVAVVLSAVSAVSFALGFFLNF